MNTPSNAASIRITLEPNVIPWLVDYCRTFHDHPLILVADENTYTAFGATVEYALRDSGATLRSIILEGKEIVPDEHAVAHVLATTESVPVTYLAVGSGTITDITRYASHQVGRPFISVPTAPSVDGFTSVVAAMVLEGVKTSVVAQPPEAVFADLSVLSAAPQAMIAAGFGDMIAKYTSLADWKLENLLSNEDYDEAIAGRVRAALGSCAEMAREIGRSTEEGVRRVMSGLLESGLCMVEFGRSNPAGGGEHHISHYLEMKLLREGRPAILHGAKVGVGTVHAARRYEWISRMPREQLARRLQAAALPDRDAEVERIRAGFGAVADQVIAAQGRFLDLTEAEFEQIKQQVIDSWDEIQAIARSVPPPKVISDLIRAAGGPKDYHLLGLTDDDMSMALTYAVYVRSRFTINRLSLMLGIA